MNGDLTKRKCVPCEAGGIKPMKQDEAGKYLAKVSGWALSKDAKKIFKEYKFKNFVETMGFVKRVADIAETEGHHPDIHIRYNRVLFELSTHAIGGLSENDFILAAKIDFE